jgi:hypothetical protein
MVLSYVILRCMYVQETVWDASQKPWFDHWFKQEILQLGAMILGYAWAILPLSHDPIKMRKRAVITWCGLFTGGLLNAFGSKTPFWSSPEALAALKTKALDFVLMDTLLSCVIT